MGWKLITLVTACLSAHLCSGQESQISENEVIRGSSEVSEKDFIDWISTLLGLTTTTFAPELDPPEDCPSCECGVARSRNRIVDGQETKVLEFPWMAVLMNKGRFYCGGSLINDFYILTAAHCTAGFQKEKITVRLLEHDRSKPNETTTIDRKVSAIIRHPLYNPATIDNDIALLKLDERVDLRNTRKRSVDSKEGSGSDESSEDELVGLRPVCLPSPELSYADYKGVVSGWGTTGEGGSVSNFLQEVYVPILSNEDCRKTGYKNRITKNMMCAGYPEGGKDACQGDSGGPLHIYNNDTYQYQEVGIVSWGRGCARPDYPGVYTRINRYLPWLKRNTKDACYCQSEAI